MQMPDGACRVLSPSNRGSVQGQCNATRNKQFKPPVIQNTNIFYSAMKGAISNGQDWRESVGTVD